MITAITATAGLIIKGYTVYNAADKVAKICQKKEITQNEAIDLFAQGLFATCQVSAIGATAMHAKNWIQLTCTVASGATDITRKVTTIYTKNEDEQWTNGDILNIVTTAAWRIGDNVAVGLDGHLQHRPACESWFCEHKDEILTDNLVMGTARDVASSLVSQKPPRVTTLTEFTEQEEEAHVAALIAEAAINHYENGELLEAAPVAEAAIVENNEDQTDGIPDAAPLAEAAIVENNEDQTVGMPDAAPLAEAANVKNNKDRAAGVRIAAPVAEVAIVKNNKDRAVGTSEAFLPLNRSEIEKELATHWKDLKCFPKWFHHDALHQCHLTGCVIRTVVICSDGIGGTLLFEKNAVEEWIANNPGKRPSHVTNWPHSFCPDQELQEMIDSMLAEWAEVTLLIHSDRS